MKLPKCFNENQMEKAWQAFRKEYEIDVDATAYKNLKVAQNLSVMQAQWKHEEEMKRLEKWNGVQVSTQSVYVPNTYDLKSGK